jgi:hypothetical protein
MANPANRIRRAARQQAAMVEQFSEPGSKNSDQQSWQRIRRAAASRKLMRPQH